MPDAESDTLGLTIAEAATQLGVSESQMLRLAKNHWIGKKEAALAIRWAAMPCRY